MILQPVKIGTYVYYTTKIVYLCYSVAAVDLLDL